SSLLVLVCVYPSYTCGSICYDSSVVDTTDSSGSEHDNVDMHLVEYLLWLVVNGLLDRLNWLCLFAWITDCLWQIASNIIFKVHALHNSLCLLYVIVAKVAELLMPSVDTDLLLSNCWHNNSRRNDIS